MARIKQRQVLPGIDKAVSNATKVYVAEACAENDILVATGTKNGFLSVVKATPNDITKCRGPFFVADYAATVGDYVAVALPWKLVTNVNTIAGGEGIGDAVWLNIVTAGGVVTGVIPGATADTAAFALAVKVGRVVRAHATKGAYLLEPGMANGAPLVGRIILATGGSTTVIGFGSELNLSPCVVNSGNAASVDASDCNANIAGGTLTIRSTSGLTTTATYMIHA